MLESQFCWHVDTSAISLKLNRLETCYLNFFSAPYKFSAISVSHAHFISKFE